MPSSSHLFDNAPPKRERWSLARLLKQKKPAQTLPHLPVELWMHVFSYVFTSDGIHYQNVDYTNFPLYQKRLLAPWIMAREMKSLEMDYIAVKSVCKAWRSMARPGPEMMLRTGYEVLPVGIETLLVRGRSDFDSFIKRVEKDLNITNQLTTLVVRSGLNASWDDPVEILLSNYKLFPAVQCLSIEHPRTSGLFWVRLRNAFPDLVSLTVSGEMMAIGTVVLDRLEILDVEWKNTVKYQCKSLRHCSFHWVLYGPSFVSFLKDHGEGLESLILRMQPANRRTINFCAEVDFWFHLPLLRTFGINLDVYSWPGFDIPTNLRSSALTHLYLTLEKVEKIEGKDDRIMVGQVQHMIRKMHWLQFLGINEGAFSHHEHAVLRGYCKMLGFVYSMVPD